MAAKSCSVNGCTLAPDQGTSDLHEAAGDVHTAAPWLAPPAIDGLQGSLTLDPSEAHEWRLHVHLDEGHLERAEVVALTAWLSEAQVQVDGLNDELHDEGQEVPC
jgi:hypothetical protein